MLKIKDDVDLKELEKFGFEDENGEYFSENMIIDSRHDDCAYVYINSKDNRKITMYVNSDDWLSEEINLDKVYDLIQAGLVEKIKEEN